MGNNSFALGSFGLGFGVVGMVSTRTCLPSNCSLKNYPHGGEETKIKQLLIKGNYEKSRGFQINYLVCM